MRDSPCTCYIIRAIILLLFLRGPTTIFFAVISIIINSVEGMMRSWSITHITMKFRKIFYPFPSHLNASSTISEIFRIVFIQTPPFCASPRYIFWRSSKLMCAGAQSIAIKTSATFGSFGCEIFENNMPNSPTITTALNQTFDRIFFWNILNGKSGKSVAHMNQMLHGGFIT